MSGLAMMVLGFALIAFGPKLMADELWDGNGGPVGALKYFGGFVITLVGFSIFVGGVSHIMN